MFRHWTLTAKTAGFILESNTEIKQYNTPQFTSLFSRLALALKMCLTHSERDGHNYSARKLKSSVVYFNDSKFLFEVRKIVDFKKTLLTIILKIKFTLYYPTKPDS